MHYAIALIGEYSNWWKSNQYYIYRNSNIVFFPLAAYTTYECQYLDDDDWEIIINKTNDQTLCESRTTIHDYYYDRVTRNIEGYEKSHGMIFDVRIFTSFKTILLDALPDKTGVYYTPYYHFGSTNVSPILQCVEILSDTHLRFNGGKTVKLEDLSVQARERLFRVLFQSKVMDFETISIPSPDVAMFVPSVVRTNGANSIFSPHERLFQTVQQLRSIHAVTGLTSIVLEGSPVTIHDLVQITKYANYVVLFSKDSKGHYYANQLSQYNKSVYEMYVLSKMLVAIPDSRFYFKFGGRYVLNNTFSLHRHLVDVPVMKIIEGERTFTGTPIVECILYSFPQSYAGMFIKLFERAVQTSIESSESVETLLYRGVCGAPIHRASRLHIVGCDAVEGFDRQL